jgi:hypothetical protein
MNVKINGLVAECNMHTFIHSFNHIHTVHLSIAEASLHFLIACLLRGETPPCGAEPKTELGPALQQADVLQIEPRRTINVKIRKDA